MWFIRRVCFVLVFLGLVASAWLKPAPIAAQAPLTGDQTAPLLNPVSEGTQQDFEAGLNTANGAVLYQTASYPGVSFHRRNSTVGYAYYGGGCTYLTALSSGNEDNNALSTRLDIPDGAVILGVEFQYRDTDAVNNSRLYLYRFDGAGGVATVALLNSSGNGGYGSSYTATNLNTLYDAFSYSYSLVWYSGSVGINHALCGAGVKYAYNPPVARPFTMPPANQPDALQGGSSGYSFTAASDFVAFEESAAYSYSSAGCMIHTGGANLAAEVDLADGTQLAGYRAYYYNTASGAAMNANLVWIDGSSTNTVLIASTTASSGFANEYFVPPSAQIIDEFSKGYLMYIRPGTSTTTRMCGIRTFYTTPVQAKQLPVYINPVSSVIADHDASGVLLTEQQPESAPIQSLDLGTVEELASPLITNEYQFVTARSFMPRDNVYLVNSAPAGCISFGSDAEVDYTFQLPPNSGLRGIRFYYRNIAGNLGNARYWAFDGRGWYNPIFTYAIPTSTNYASQLVSYTGSHYDLSNGSVAHSLNFSILSPSNTVEFCGARIWYTTGLRSLYIPVAFKN